jgi:hypothetical protein
MLIQGGLKLIILTHHGGHVKLEGLEGALEGFEVSGGSLDLVVTDSD